MKFIISDYSSYNQTEPLYFDRTLNLLDGCSSTLWNGSNISAYDIFDLVKPNIWITHIKSIVTDALAYMAKENNDIQLIVNITGATQEEVSNVENFILDKNINCAFFFTNLDDSNIQCKKIKILTLPLGIDLFTRNGKLKYSIDKGVIINDLSAIKPEVYTYHYLSNNLSLDGKVDITLSIDKIASIISNYKEIVFTYFDRVIPQLFFDASYRTNKVYFNIADSEKTNYVNSKFKKLLKIDYDICDENINFEEIKQKIKSKHTCMNRVKSLLSQLPCHDLIKSLEAKIGEQL
jgi:hypothetical protein